MVERFLITLPQLTGEKKRRAFVYLPDRMKTGERYPVLYMFDGHNLFSDEEATFGKSWGLSDFLDKNRVKIIVAAVECNQEGNGRLEEYSPVNFTLEDGTYIRGKGKKYMDWLVKDFKPYIDKTYPTVSDRAHTAIAGSSMGGLMTLYALSKYNKYFSCGAALSPSLWTGGTEVLNFLKTGKFASDTRLFLDYGSREFEKDKNRQKSFANTCAYLIERGVFVTARVVPYGTHSERSWEKEIPYFMKTLFNGKVY